MMRINKLINLSKTLVSTLLATGILSSANLAQAAVSQAPLNLVEGVAPNMLFTLDESGSMSWGYVPDADSSVAKRLTSQMNDEGNYNTYASVSSRRFYSHRTNPMYYNPHVIYEIPPAFKEDGSEYKLTTSFTSAPINGFRPNDGSKNLSSSYRAVYEHRMPVNDPKYAVHPNYSSNHVADNGVKDVGRDYMKWINYRYGGGYWEVNDAPAYYYEFDGDLVHTAGTKNTPAVLCSERRDDERLGGERCYRVRYVTESSAYDENGNRLKHADGQDVDGRQNFAIWYSFYKTRALATLSAASIAFYDLSSNIRFSWQDLATCRSFDGSDEVHCKKNGLQSYSEKHRGQFYSWLRDVYFNVGTPLPAAMIRAGEFYKSDMPWRMYPQDPAIGQKNTRNTTENTLACRPSYHVLMTDGMWNTRQTYKHVKSVNWGNVSWSGYYDNTEVSYPALNTDDSMPAPYGDTTKKTLADIAMHYWKTDLRGLPNKVPPFMPYKSAGDNDPRNNPATWQHMTNFIMGLGLTNSLNNPNIPWEGQTHTGAGYNALKSGSVKWPVAGLSTSTDWWDNTTENNGTGLDTNVYDLWHAAINSRGEFYSVESPESMVKAFKDIMNRIAERQSTAALPAIASSVEEVDKDDPDSIQRLASYFYNSSFDSTDWSGDLEKIKKYITYEDSKRKEVSESVWKASNKLPKHAERKIYTAGSVKNGMAELNENNISNELKNALNKLPDTGVVDNKWKARLAFIRGDRTEEGKAFRERSSVLGDFLGSSPVLVSGARYLEGFANKVEGPNHTKYTAFVNTKKSRRAQVYIGGNDGMLHAFDAATGIEEFAFIPTAVFSNLNRLTDLKYSETHHFFVDGTPEVADIYDGQNWRTILVGTLRAGGKGIFALDITDPDDIKLLWELDQNSAVFKDKVKPGYSFSKPTIARLHNGRWAVVTGNGYENGDDSGKAALYIIDAVTGALTKDLPVQSTKATHNGLSTPKLVDYDGDGVADYAYAGDLHGNLWRFDLLGVDAKENREKTAGSIYGDKTGNTDKFKVSYNKKPMFTAEFNNNRQAITAPPSIVRHPDRLSYLVVFGTGKYYEDGDKGGDVSIPQSMYAIWDEKTKAQDTSVVSLNVSRSDLQQQKFEDQVTGENKIVGVEREARVLSKNNVDWQSKKGWVLDLKVAELALVGEMLVDDMAVVGSTLLFSSLVPNDDPCADGSGNWLYAINPFTGGRTERHVFDTRGSDGNVLSAIKFGGPGGVPLNLTPGGLEVPSNNPSDGYEGINIAEMTGRQTWRAVPNP